MAWREKSLGHLWGMDGTFLVGEVRLSSSILIFLKINKPLFHALLDDLSRFLKCLRHAVKVAGILFQTGDAEPRPFRVRPLRQANVDHKAFKISSTLRTRPMRGKICVILL